MVHLLCVIYNQGTETSLAGFREITEKNKALNTELGSDIFSPPEAKQEGNSNREQEGEKPGTFIEN